MRRGWRPPRILLSSLAQAHMRWFACSLVAAMQRHHGAHLRQHNSCTVLQPSLGHSARWACSKLSAGVLRLP
jgi:hypothetical protein